ELVALATQLGKLDDLARRAEDPQADARGRLALLAVVRAAQQRDADAAEDLKRLRPLLARLPSDAPPLRRWPELIAAAGALSRPPLREAARALLDDMIRQAEKEDGQETPQLDRQRWLRQVRHVLARLELRSLPGGEKIPFGADPKLRCWA